MKISVIIPTYNEEMNIARMLEQLKYIDDIEVIVSDGGSSDRTGEICSGYGVKLVSSAKGRGNQLIAGAGASEGDILFFLHADSAVDDDAFGKIRMAVRSGTSWGCCTLKFDDYSFEYRMCAFMSNVRSRTRSICYGDQGIFCEKRFYEANGGFLNIPIMEDLEFSCRMRKKAHARVIDSSIITSARRFKAVGFWRMVLLMQKMKALYFLGAPMERLVDTYRNGR